MKDLFTKYGRNISPIDEYKKNIYSQNGEDGIIQHILSTLGIVDPKNMWVVEFGAWDGKHLSNTFSLVEKGANAVYIEGDTKKYKDLSKTCQSYGNIIPINAFVGYGNGSGFLLDNLLSDTDIPVEFDLLSIDIDSHDLDVWDSLKKYNPSIVVIEVNSSVPIGVYQRHSAQTPGNSFSATLQVGIDKGYQLVSHVGNMIFVRNDLFGRLHYPKKLVGNPELLFNDFWIKMGGFLRFYDWTTSFANKCANGLLKLL